MSDERLARAWLDAVRDADVRAELERVYDDVRTEVETRGPACWASGRCCNFERTGHLLYVTGLEAAHTIDGLERTLSTGDVQNARSRGGCPFQDMNLCGEHAIRPLGCRVYFCDRSAQSWQQDLAERMIARVRTIHDDFAIEYRYGEWRAMLELFAR